MSSRRSAGTGDLGALVFSKSAAFRRDPTGSDTSIESEHRRRPPNCLVDIGPPGWAVGHDSSPLLFRLAKQPEAIAYPLRGGPSRNSRASDADEWRGALVREGVLPWRFWAPAAPFVLYC